MVSTRRHDKPNTSHPQYFFLFQLFYKCVITFNKLAFLLLYLRVFQIHSFRLICLASIAFVITGSFSFITATLFECTPISYNWNRATAGHCINNSAFRWSWAAFNTLTDVWVSGLPIPFIQRLQMTATKKLGLIILFALGLFVCVASAIRMKALVASTHAKDTTWDSAPAFLWSYIEAAVGLICTCLPSLRWLLSRALPFLSASSESSRATPRYWPGRSSERSRRRSGGGAAAARAAFKMRDLSSSGGTMQYPGLVPDKGRSRIETTTVATTGNRYGEGGSEERIIEHAGDPNSIQVRTCVSVRSSSTSAVGVD